jgi:AraC-like DNA-binding protein
MTEPWIYREQAPPASLATHVQAIWSESVGARRDDPGARILPDGCIDLIWFTGCVPMVAGPQTEPVFTTAPPGSLVVGIRFRTGAAGRVLGWPADELRDRSVPLSDLWGHGALDPLARSEGSTSPAERLDAMQAVLLARLARAEAPDRAALFAAGWLGSHPDARLDALHELSGLSERQLRRRFESAVGYGPKTFQRIARFRRWLHQARYAPPDSRRLIDLAADAGYADQAHLTREVTRLAGLPPAALLATYEAGE